MSKAEEKAMQYCCTKCANNKLNCGMKLLSHGRNCIACSNYITGYHQAEKDLELTWEDIKIILNAFLDFKIESIKSRKNRKYTDEDYCVEILKRFKDLKHVK